MLQRSAGMVIASAVVLAACAPSVAKDTVTDASTTSTSTSSGTTTTTATDNGSTTTSTTTIDPDTGVVETSAVDTSSSGDSGCPTSGCEPDVGLPSMDCDPYVQNCLRGEKCVPWSTNGVDWDSTRCSPIPSDPDVVGETCTAREGGTNGLDSCERGALCWEVDGETLEGTCVELCNGSPDSPMCNGPETACLGSDEILALCFPTCDPKDPMCAPNQVCAPAAGDEFVCANVGG